jgi:hypothetical protein
MKIIPVSVRNHRPSANNSDELVARSEPPMEGIDESRNLLRWLLDQSSYFPEKIALDSRVLIIEGISGSGKDTLQRYLKKKLKGRDVHDYSEGELLQSWKQLQIGGILGLRVKFMKLFVNYVKDILDRDENAVFLLNRFHLSTYTSTIIQQPKLEKEYGEIISILRTLPVHIFILQLDEHEIEQRSLHPERSTAWQKHQKQIIKREGFRNTLGRHIWQQRLILEAAEGQRIPYSVIKLPEIGDKWDHVSEAPSVFRSGVRINAADAKISRRKRDLPQTL